MDQKKIINSINKRIKVRKEQISDLAKSIKELDNILKGEEVGSDQTVKVIHQKNQLSNRLVKLTDEIEAETQKKNKLLSETISSDDLKMEDLQKKIKHRDIQIKKLNDQLISREQVEQQWETVTIILADLGQKLSKSYHESEPAIQYFRAAVKKLEEVSENEN